MKYKVANKTPEALWIHKDLLTDRIDNSYYRLEFIKSDLRSKNIKQQLLKDMLKSPLTDFGSFSLTKEIEYVSKGIPYIRSSDFKEFFIEEENIYCITDEVNKILSKSEVFEGDILITKMGSDMGKAAVISKLPLNLGKCNSNATIAKVRIRDEFDKHYIVAYLNSKYAVNNVWRNAVGSVQPRVNLSDIENYAIAIPSTEIQKYIGDKVREAEKLREEAKSMKNEVEDTIYRIIELEPLDEEKYSKSSFVKSKYIDSERLDSSYYSNEYIRLESILNEKNIVQLKDIIIDSKYGASISANYLPEGIPFIRGTNLIANEIDEENIVYLDEKLKSGIGKCIVNTGDILITRSGTVGISAVVDEQFNNFAYGSFMIKLSIKDNMWNAYYVSAYLNSYWGKWQIERLQNGAVQQNINLQELGRIMIPNVSLDIQSKIEELVKSYINNKKKAKKIILEVKQDVEDLVEGNFDISKIKETN